ncbi:MAG: glutathione S-transferase family protein [Gammaproteobacteria bacterium]|nr:glutathione S-transferase family protein [Gammaproteobacteria bacterium]
MSDLTLVIGNKNYSSWSLRPWIFMKQFQIEFKEKKVFLFTDTTDDELAQYNSNSKVPVLLDKELVIWDSLAILEYLSEQYLAGGGLPKSPDVRAISRSISAEMHSSFFNIRNDLPMNCRKPLVNIALSAETQTEVQRIATIWHQCRVQYGDAGEWLFGQYSIADAMFAPIVLRFHTYGVKLDGQAQAYMQSVLQQKHIIDWIAAGKEETEVIDGY